MPLDDVQGRILGSMVEKELATPQQYPLTLNALLLACNQTSNRDPVMLLSEGDVQRALDVLKAERLVRHVFPSHGRSAIRYRHILDESLGLEQQQLALMAVLLLRGPQTAGELRARTERLARFDRLDDVEQELQALAARSEPLVEQMARLPGQKEERYRQTMTGAPVTVGGPAPLPSMPSTSASPAGPGLAGTGPVAPHPAPAAHSGAAVPPDTIEQLRAELAATRQELATLRLEFDALRDSLGG